MFTKSALDTLNAEIFRSSICAGSFYGVNLVTGFVTQSGPLFTERPDHTYWRGRNKKERKVLYLKACPKCQGDIELVVFPDSKTLSCLQCSFTVDSQEAARRAMSEWKTPATTEAA
jgi:hypothetical protein